MATFLVVITINMITVIITTIVIITVDIIACHSYRHNLYSPDNDVDNDDYNDDDDHDHDVDDDKHKDKGKGKDVDDDGNDNDEDNDVDDNDSDRSIDNDKDKTNHEKDKANITPQNRRPHTMTITEIIKIMTVKTLPTEATSTVPVLKIIALGDKYHFIINEHYARGFQH